MTGVTEPTRAVGATLNSVALTGTVAVAVSGSGATRLSVTVSVAVYMPTTE